jgi:hypothetical protein
MGAMKFPPLTSRILVAPLCLVAIALAAFAIYRGSTGDRDRKAARMREEVGAVMARQARRVVGAPGRVLLIVPEPGEPVDPKKKEWMDEQIASFQRHLGGRLVIAARETVRVPMPRRAANGGGPGDFTCARYAEMLRRYPGMQAVISFAGAPAGNGAFPMDAGGRPPPMICFSASGEGVEALMRQGVIAAAIVPRNEPAPVKAIRGDWFPVLYRLVTPDEAQDTAAVRTRGARRSPPDGDAPPLSVAAKRSHRGAPFVLAQCVK